MSPVGLTIGVEPVVIEEPYEGNLHVRICGGGAPGNRCFYLEADGEKCGGADAASSVAPSAYLGR